MLKFILPGKCETFTVPEGRKADLVYSKITLVSIAQKDYCTMKAVFCSDFMISR